MSKDTPGKEGSGDEAAFSTAAGHVPGAESVAADLAGEGQRPRDEEVVDVETQSGPIDRLEAELEVETVSVRDDPLGSLAWDVGGEAGGEDSGDTAALLPLKPMIGGAAAAAVVLAGLFFLRSTGDVGPAPAVAAPSSQGTTVAVADVETPAEDGDALARVGFGTFATQADAEAICFELWAHEIDAEVHRTPAGWTARTADTFDPDADAVGRILKLCNDLMLPADLIPG